MAVPSGGLTYAEDGEDKETPQERDEDDDDAGGRQQRQRRIAQRDGARELKERRRRVELRGHRRTNRRNARRFIDFMQDDGQAFLLVALPPDALPAHVPGPPPSAKLHSMAERFGDTVVSHAQNSQHVRQDAEVAQTDSAAKKQSISRGLACNPSFISTRACC